MDIYFIFGKILGLGVKYLRCGDKYFGKVEKRNYLDFVRFIYLFLNWVESIWSIILGLI